MPRSWLRFTLEALFIVLVAVIAGVVHLSTPGIIGAMAVAWVLVALYEWTMSRERPARPAMETGELGGVEPPPLVEERATALEPVTAEGRAVPSGPEETQLAAPMLAAAGGFGAWRRRFRRAVGEPPPAPAEAEPATHVRVLGREVEPSPEVAAVRPAAERVEAPPAAAPVEPEPARPLAEPLPAAEEPPVEPPAPAPEPEPAPPPQLQPVAAAQPPPEPEPEPEPEPLTPAAQQVVALPTRGGPREWNLWDLERLAREHAGRDVMVDEERNYLLMYLREFANADGVLPVDFDGLVRDSFGDLVGAPR
jgi:hypothetical protein